MVHFRRERGYDCTLYPYTLGMRSSSSYVFLIVEISYVQTVLPSTKVRLDYAIVLIATSAMEVIKGEAELLIDDVLVKIKVMEEWATPWARIPVF
jgi:hypothetical protein